MLTKNQARCFFFLFAQILIMSCHADDDDFFLDDINLDDIVHYESEHHIATRPFHVPSNTLAANLSDIVKEPLWQNTMAPKGRDVLYLLPHKITALENGGFAFTYFFNMTDKLHVSAKSLLELNFDQKGLEAAIGEFLDLIPGASSQEIFNILPLFEKISIQERKAGAFLQGSFIRGPFTIQIHTSVLMGERNFWLSEKDRAIIQEIGDKISPGQDLDEKELYIIKYGMGDTRIKAGMNTLNMPNLQTDLGIEAILPTSRFTSKPKLAMTDLDSLQNLKPDLLYGLRDYLINPQHGNGGHFGIGCYFESKIGIFHNLAQLWTRMSYDRLFANEEDRFIMFKKTISPDDLKNLDEPTANIKLPIFIREYLFPTPFKVTIKPGGIFNFVTSVNVDVKRWRFALGYDFYAQQREEITAIHNSNDDPSILRIEGAEAVSSKQHKVFTEAIYIKKFKKSDLGIGLGGDVTVHSVGIGYDWTSYFKVAASF